MTPPLDLSRPVTTRDGRPARIICTDRKGPYPLVVLIDNCDSEATAYYCSKGLAGTNASSLDLINAPIKYSGWLNVYRDGDTAFWDDRSAADKHQVGRIACIRVEFVEGEGIA